MATPEEAAQTARLLNGSNGHENFDDQADQAGVSAHAFHTRLVDTNSSKFRTEVFQVKYCKVGDAVRHLIGLREITDQQSLARQSVTLPACDPDDSSMSCPYRLLGSADGSPVAQANNRCSSAKSMSEGEKEVRPIVYLTLGNLTGSCSVVEASVSASSLVGIRVTELFPGMGSQSLEGLLAEVDRCEVAEEVGLLAQKQHFFKEWLVQWSPGQTDYVDGLVHILKSDSGSHQLLLCCRAANLSPLASPSGVSSEAPRQQSAASAFSILPGMPFEDRAPSLH